MRKRPSWNDYFMTIAYVVSQRSHDSQTQHGCVITSQDNIILSVGYNGFPRGMNDEDLPNTRPDKYPWCIHSERNALANCQIRPKDGKAYVTGQCCNDCIMALWQHGITEVYMLETHDGSALLNEDTKKIFDRFVKETGIKVHYINVDADFLFTDRLKDFLFNGCPNL